MQTLHQLFRCVLLAAVPLLAGCGSGSSPAPAPQASDKPLKDLLDETLSFTAERKLTTEDHAAWQILHGVLAYRREFRIEHEGQPVRAVDFLLQGGAVSGFDVEVVPRGERAGLRALMQAGSKSGQGHADQWLAVLAQAGLTAEQEIQIDGRPFQIRDFVSQVQADIYRNADREYSWTLIALTSFLPTTAEWKDANGDRWSIENLVEIEAAQDLNESTCGGTHRLIGLQMALDRHRQQGGQMEGAWQTAEAVIQQAVARAKSLQHPDGSFSTDYFAGPASSLDFGENLGTTGHILEFLALALSDEQLKEPWVERSVRHLCDLFSKTKSIPLECGKLYHAAHGLLLYRERRFGPIANEEP